MILNYQTLGEGAPLVILHGLYGSSDNWLQIGRKLASEYQVILADLRNHGASSHEQSHTYEDMVTDLAWLMKELEISDAHVLGHSMGGKAAIAFACDYPEMIRSLIVADIAPKNYLATPASALQYDFHKGILNTLSSLNLEQFESLKQVEEALKDDIPELAIRKFMLKNLERKDKGFRWKINVSALKEHLDSIIKGVDSNDYEDRIPIMQYPVLFIKGELSGYIQDEDEERIKKMYPEAKIVSIKDATHLLHAEKPEEFTKIVMDFLRSAKH